MLQLVLMIYKQKDELDVGRLKDLEKISEAVGKKN